MSVVWEVIRRRSRPPPPAPFRDRRVSVTVYGPPMEAISAMLTPDDGPAIAASGEDRHHTFVVPAAITGGAWLHVAAEGYEPMSTRIVLPLTDAELDAVTLRATIPTRLVIAGQWFAFDSGERWTQIGCSDFRLFERYLRGEAIHELLRDRVAIGFNQLRVFGMGHGLFRLYPQEHPNYYAQLISFAELVGRAGLRLEVTVFVDAIKVMPSLDDQLTHLARVVDALMESPHVFVELVNENDQTINVINTGVFVQPAGLISSHGSNGADAVPPQPPWSYQVLHPARPADWPRRGGHNAMEDLADPSGKPAYSNELCRPDQGRGPLPADWFDAAASGVLLTAGAGTFHSQAGKQSIVLEGAERLCAEAFVAGARAVPLDYQRGAYTSGHLSTTPLLHRNEWASRTYARMAGDRACAVVLQRTPAWRPTSMNGWRLVRQHDSVIELVR